MALRGKTPTTFNFYLSCDINQQVKVRVSDLQGRLPSFREVYDLDVPSTSTSAVYVVARLTAGKDLLGLEARTTYSDSAVSGCIWGEWLTFCVKYRDLPHDTQLSLAVWEVSEGSPPLMVGGTTMPLFSQKGRLKSGPQRLRVWEGRPPCTAWPSTTPGKVPLSQRGRIGRLEHLVKMYNRGDIPQVDWLDALTMGEIRHLQQQHAELQQAAGTSLPDSLTLVADLPAFPHAVLYHQPLSYTAATQLPGTTIGTAVGPTTLAGTPAMKRSAELSAGALVAAAAAAGGDRAGAAAQLAGAASESVIVLLDPEVGRDNPSELKAQKLARSLTRGVIDRDLKPNSEERKRITAVLKLPPNKALPADARALLWRFRFSLTQETRALTKFLKCVDWSDAGEARQATELMGQWASIGIADALELLSPDFRNEEVRAHAVSVLQQSDDDEVLCYLLQLVQALRYESGDRSRLARFLVGRAARNPHFAVMLHWYLFTEWEDPAFGSRASILHNMMVAALQQQGAAGEKIWEGIRRQTDMVSQLSFLTKELKSSKVRVARATQRLQEMVSQEGPCGELTHMRVPLPLNPSLLLTGLVPQECMCFRSAQLPLRLSFRVDPFPVDWKGGRDGPQAGAPGSGSGSGGPQPTSPGSAPGSALARTSTLSSPSSSAVQQQQQAGLDAAAGSGGHGSGSGSGHAGQQHHGSSSGHSGHHHHHHGLSPSQVLQTLPGRTGIVVQGDSVRCVMIYKKGDDLRQDQFILQMISLMDRLLKRENLDLRLTPYKVLPTSGDDGLVEFVPSMPLSRVLAEHRTIHKYLAQYQADPGGPFGLKAETLETFVRSCAGYCVATYILGVGDRHLDNLMLTADGRLFHIDFGYILGNDPKPFPPPMKICKEMVEAMGGQGSEYYVQFRMYACEAYNILRKSSDLILSLFHLMAGASIEAIRSDPEKAILKLQEKFRLEAPDEAAVEWMQQLINESATALMPQIVETTHRWAQYWR